MRPWSRALPRSCVAAAALVLALPGCGNGTAGGPGGLAEASVSDSAGVTIVTHPAGLFSEGAVPRAPFASDFAGEPALRIGLAEGEEAYQFTNPLGGARLSDGRFVILDGQSRTLRYFSPDGTHERTVGRSGDGPGEFRTPRQLLHLEGDTVAIFDLAQQRIHLRAPDGSLVREHALPDAEFGSRTSGIAPGPGGSLLTVGSSVAMASGGEIPEGEVRPDAVLHRVDPDGAVTRIDTFPGETSVMQVIDQGGGRVAVMTSSWWFLPNLLTAPAPGLRAVWHTDGVAGEVSLRGEDGSPTRVVRFTDPLQRFTPEIVARIHADELERATTPQARETLLSSQDQREYPAFLPPIRDLWGDQVGRPWVGPLALPVGNLPSGLGRDQRDWLVLDPDGGVMGAVRLPPRSRPLWASDEGVLLVRLGDLDIPVVEWWPAGG